MSSLKTDPNMKEARVGERERVCVREKERERESPFRDEMETKRSIFRVSLCPKKTFRDTYLMSRPNPQLRRNDDFLWSPDQSQNERKEERKIQWHRLVVVEVSPLGSEPYYAM